MAESEREVLITCGFCQHCFRPPWPVVPGVGDSWFWCPECSQRMPESAAMEQDVPPEGAPAGLDWSHKFVRSADTLRHYSRMRESNYDEAIRPAVKAFIRNMDRAGSIMSFLFDIVGGARYSQTIQEVAAHTGKTRLEVSQMLGETCIEPVRVQHLGKTFIDKVVATEAKYHPAVESLMASQVIGAWTAFESLVEDLWMRCLNARPRLGIVALASPGESEQKTHQFRILQKWLDDPDFVLAKNLGRVARLQPKWRFDDREKAADAYYRVFPQDKAELKETFDADEIKMLAAYRNNLVHNGGIVDEPLYETMGRFSDLPLLAVGMPVPLTGRLVAHFVTTADVRGTLLIEFVQKWLTENKG